MFTLLILTVLSCLYCFGIGIEVVAFNLYKQKRINYDEYKYIKSWKYAYKQIINTFKNR